MTATRVFVCLAAIASNLLHVVVAANRTGYTGLQTTSQAFHAAGRTPGTVTFEILPEPDPSRYGVPLLGFGFKNSNHTVGFPTAYGKVSSPNSLGYSSYYGWIQVIASSKTELPADQMHWMIDLLPTFATLNNPFVWYGSEATLFDHPFPLGDLKELDWNARSFLCYMPNPAYSKTVVPLAAFEWGYWIDNGVPKVKELKNLDVNVWNSQLGLLRNNFTEWDFKHVS